MNTIVLLFWFWIPWLPGDPTFGYFELELRSPPKTYNECLETRDYLIGHVQTRYPQGSVANGLCYPKGTFYESTIDWEAFKSRLEKDLEAGRKAFESEHGGGDH